jgi:hypothetical protein
VEVTQQVADQGWGPAGGDPHARRQRAADLPTPSPVASSVVSGTPSPPRSSCG